MAVTVVLSSQGVELLQEFSRTRQTHLSDAILKAAVGSIGILSGLAINTMLARRRLTH